MEIESKVEEFIESTQQPLHTSQEFVANPQAIAGREELITSTVMDENIVQSYLMTKATTQALFRTLTA